MNNTETEFLSGAALSEKIRHICAGHNIRCAVAFWGVGAAPSLFPQGLEDAVLVCDISMGGTPKAALREMNAPSNPRLLVRDGLHAKIYASDRGAVIGSANASANGVGLLPNAAGRLIEAGVFCAIGSAAYIAAVKAVDELISNATPVTAQDVERAPERSKEQRPMLAVSAVQSMSLLKALRTVPEEFENLSIAVVTDDDLEEERAKVIKRQYLSETKTLSDGDLGQAFIQDNGDGAIETLQRTVIMFDMSKKSRSRWSATVFTRVDLLPKKQPEFGFAVQGSNRLSGKLRALIHGKKLSDSEWEIVHQLAEQNDTSWAFTPKGFADALARSEEFTRTSLA